MLNVYLDEKNWKLRGIYFLTYTSVAVVHLFFRSFDIYVDILYLKFYRIYIFRLNTLLVFVKSRNLHVRHCKSVELGKTINVSAYSILPSIIQFSTCVHVS